MDWVPLSTWQWGWPWALLLLPLPIVAWWVLPSWRAPRQQSLRVPELARFEDAGASSVPRRGWIGAFLLTLCWIALIVALARPQSLGEPLGTPVSGRELLLAIDASSSMDEKDMSTAQGRISRMAAVKRVARDFLERRQGDRIGLILFGSQAFMQTPLTHDHDTVAWFLDAARTGVAGNTTAIGDAIGLGIRQLRERPADSRVLILLTDGANSDGVVEPLSAAELAAANDIRIHTIGVGGERGGGLLGFAFGQRSALDEATLTRIAETTGGQYFRARDPDDLVRIYAEIDRLEPALDEDPDFRPLQERFAWPLGVALVINLLWAALRFLVVPVSAHREA